MSEFVQEADVRLTREDAFIIVEGLKNTVLTDEVKVKDLPKVVARIHQVMQKVSEPFTLPPPEAKEAEENTDENSQEE